MRSLCRLDPDAWMTFGVKQLIMLPPGSYQFRGNYKVDITSQRGLLWRITCARGPKTLIGESPRGQRSWSAVEGF